jgi:hypothetical protein
MLQPHAGLDAGQSAYGAYGLCKDHIDDCGAYSLEGQSPYRVSKGFKSKARAQPRPPVHHRTASRGASYGGCAVRQAELDFEWAQCMYDPMLWIFAPLGYEALAQGAWRRGPCCLFFSHPAFAFFELSYGRMENS